MNQDKTGEADGMNLKVAIFDFRGPIMSSLKSPCTTCCRSSIDTIALNYLLFEKIAFFAFWRQKDRQTNRCTKSLSLSRAAA